MAVSPFYHFGILVEDLDAAIERFAELFGLTFIGPRTFQINRLADPDEHSLEVHAAYSHQGPPHLELVEAVGDGLYSPSRLGFHHVGLWDPAIDANRATYLGEKALRSDARVITPTDATLAWFSHPSSACGIRFEFVDEAMKAPAEELILDGGPRRGEVVL
jgi:catechol 2,3-dioxygenase-like lactoylglutathione lyase family enzyme